MVKNKKLVLSVIIGIIIVAVYGGIAFSNGKSASDSEEQTSIAAIETFGVDYNVIEEETIEEIIEADLNITKQQVKMIPEVVTGYENTELEVGASPDDLPEIKYDESIVLSAKIDDTDVDYSSSGEYIAVFTIVFETEELIVYIEENEIEEIAIPDGYSSTITTSFNMKILIVEKPEPETVADEKSDTSDPDYTYTKLSKTMYAESSVNVRTLPSTDGNIVGALSTNEEVSVTGRCNETGWYRIEYNGSNKYVSDNYLSANKTVITNTSSSASSSGTSSSNTSSYSGIVKFTSSSIDRNLGYTVETELSHVPDIILNYLYDHGWTITLTNDLSPYTSVNDAIGVCTFSKKTIHILANSSAIRLSTVHEIGHAAQRYKNYATSYARDAYEDDIALGIFYSPDRPGENLSHFTYSLEEYDAQCFLIYYKYGKSTLKDAAPNYSSLFLSNMDTWISVIS